MRGTLYAIALSSVVVVLFAGCPPPKGGPGGPGGGGTAIDPAACGDINTSKVGRKLYAFLVASAALDSTSHELEQSVHDACVKMCVELGVPTDGDTRTVCKRANDELKANLQVSVSQEQRLVTRYTPPVCQTKIDFTADFVAQCEAKVAADVSVSCEGSCGGTCNGTCDGTCTGSSNAGQTSGACNGTCNGTCHGSCTGSCQGYASVEASAECKASAEINATVHEECSEPKVEVVRENVTVVDDSKFQKAMHAIDAGMPTLLRVGAKAELVGKALVAWVQTAGSLAKASGQLVDELGERGVCVAGQIAASFAAVADVQARVSVSIEVSASVSATAGGTAQ